MMRATVLAPFVLNGKVVAAGETINLTEEQFDSVRPHVAPVTPLRIVGAEKKDIGIDGLMTAMEPKPEKKIIEKAAPAVEKKVVGKKAIKKPVKTARKK